MIINKKNLFGIFLFVLSTLFFASSASAATLSMKNSATSIKVGDTITLGVYVNTQGKSINNAEASIKFSNNLIDVMYIFELG